VGLQTDNLAMIGLGVLNNQPANPYQHPLVDGIHLRWGFLRELGFPWGGFYLFRRPAQAGQPLCLSSVTGRLKKGNWPDNKHYTAIGVLSSDVNLVLTDDFTPTNQVEFDLAGRSYLRFELPEGEVARRIDLRIGFRWFRCLDFGKLIELQTPSGTNPGRGGPPQPSLTLPNPLNMIGQTTFEVKDSNGNPAANTHFDSIQTTAGPLTGLACGSGLTIKLSTPCNALELLITRLPAAVPVGATFSVDAFDSSNNKVATAQLQNVAGQQEGGAQTHQPGTVNLTGQNIIRIEVPSVGNTTRLHRLCGDNLQISGVAVVKGTAFFGTVPVSDFSIDSNAGQIYHTSVEADAITSIEIGTCDGALVDLCCVPVSQGATDGWQLLPGFTYPMGLPVTQAAYPCSVPNPQSLVTNRVLCPLPSGWDGSTFTELHNQLVELVKGGPGSAPMVDRIFTAPPAVSDPSDQNPPKLNSFYIFDMILLGALHPALAQLVGLYWIDQTADPNLAYDYLIVADHAGVGQGDAGNILTTIQSSGFAQLDGYIVFNKSNEFMASTSFLPWPDGLQTYELPGGTFPDAQGQLPPASNNAGLRWDVGWDDSDALLPDYAVMYLVWRAYLGNADAPGPAGTYNLVTMIPPDKPKPLLVTEARLPNGVAPHRSPDWPAVPLHFIDRNLPDGWYSYEVSGIDLFGRHSRNSTPVQILLRDKIPPPMPTAVEAYVLDPDDPFVQKDAAYKNWFTSLDASVQATLVGVRVRWAWTPAYQRQAPDTKEFRIYFHPGADLPADRDQAINWQERYYVVDYDDNFTIDPLSGDRLYEIFLPPPTADSLTSVPLNPTLAEPVVYAHIGVSAADDKIHTTDQRTTGDWGNRQGNEGCIGPPSKIYRVLRTPPAPPEDVFAGERLYASPADYHNRSFFTYRWKPQPLLKLHVSRAMDDAVFKADWSQHPYAPPRTESKLEFFPAGWNQATRQAIVDELNQLNGFVGVDDGTAQAMAYYRQLSDGALRVLAGLPSSESAFIQVTINPLDPNDAANTNRLGPDNADDLVLDPNERAFIDTLDGRSTNCYFYRAAAIDDGHNLGAMGLSSPPVYLPKVFPPNTPVLTKIRGGEKQIELRWVTSREADLSAYRVYRTSDSVSTRDLRKMVQVNELPVAKIDPNQSEVSWIDQAVPAGIDFYYRVTALDSEPLPNESTPSKILIGRAVDTALPQIPEWISAEWVIYDAATKSMQPWPESDVIALPYKAAIRLELQTTADFCTIYRRLDDEKTWQGMALSTREEPGNWVVFDLDARPSHKSTYRAIASNHLGVTSRYSELMVVEQE
jgi:hypothetical protein